MASDGEARATWERRAASHRGPRPAHALGLPLHTSLQAANPWNGPARAASRTCSTRPAAAARATRMHVRGLAWATCMRRRVQRSPPLAAAAAAAACCPPPAHRVLSPCLPQATAMASSSTSSTSTSSRPAAAGAATGPALGTGRRRAATSLSPCTCVPAAAACCRRLVVRWPAACAAASWVPRCAGTPPLPRGCPAAGPGRVAGGARQAGERPAARAAAGRRPHAAAGPGHLQAGLS